MTQLPDHERDRLSELLVDWQATGDHSVLARLLDAGLPLIRLRVRQALAGMHVVDPWAIAEAVSLVLEHLRRLPLGEVAAFRPGVGGSYIRWLSQARARDVARRHRVRQQRRRRLLSMAATSDPRCGRLSERLPTPLEDVLAKERSERLALAVARLPRRQREVAHGLLEGKSQADLSRTLGICEGTVSRLRAKALERIREALRDEPSLLRDGAVMRVCLVRCGWGVKR
jgi:RNA polymerase sigma factor (sigma-70 family)